MDEGKHTVAINEAGIAKVEEVLQIENLYDAINTPLVHHLQNAVRAKELYKRDDEYIVRDGEVPDRRRVHRPGAGGPPLLRGPPPGHRGQGRVSIKEENQTYATITLQNYFTCTTRSRG